LVSLELVTANIGLSFISPGDFLSFFLFLFCKKKKIVYPEPNKSDLILGTDIQLILNNMFHHQRDDINFIVTEQMKVICQDTFVHYIGGGIRQVAYGKAEKSLL
jgi:hypothetical protein